MRIIKPAPIEVVTNGQFNFGCYNEPIKRVNLLDADLGLKIYKKQRLREWQAFQMLLNDEWFVMSAIYDTKTVALVQFILFNINTKEKYRYEVKTLPSKLTIANSLYKTQSSFSSKKFSFVVDHDLSSNLLGINVKINGFKSLPDIAFEANGAHNVTTSQPIVVVMPFTQKKGMYSHKNLMPVSGNLKIDNNTIDFEGSTSSLIIDDHKGYYPYPTKYDWNTGLGFLESGERFGFNLTDNQVKNQEEFNENCIWVDGKMIPLPPIKVTRPEGYKKAWYIKDIEGKVDLTFEPVVHNAVNLNLGLIASKYQGPYGFFTGKFETSESTYEINKMFGMGEEFYLRA